MQPLYGCSHYGGAMSPVSADSGLQREGRRYAYTLCAWADYVPKFVGVGGWARVAFVRSFGFVVGGCLVVRLPVYLMRRCFMQTVNPVIRPSSKHHELFSTNLALSSTFSKSTS